MSDDFQRVLDHIRSTSVMGHAEDTEGRGLP